MYCLQSRYYDPEVGRFINADSQISTGSDLTGMNLFAYCGNNPVSRIDNTGRDWVFAGKRYFYNGTMADFHRAEQGLPPLEYEAAIYADIAARISPWGNPNTHVDDYSDGYHKERWYGPDGRAIKDRHHTDHNNPKHHTNPHDHDWDWSDPGRPKLGSTYPSPAEMAINWGAVMGVGLVCVAGAGILWLVLNDMTGVGVFDNGEIIPLFGVLEKGLQMAAG